MNRFFPFFAAVLIAIGITSPTSLSAVDSIDGTYRDSAGRVEITIEACGNARCGNITRLVACVDCENVLDDQNDDPSLRSRPLLGITLLNQLRWADGAWRGRVYNPEDGGTYRTEVRASANGGLEVKGCFAFICRTRIWPLAE